MDWNEHASYWNNDINTKTYTRKVIETLNKKVDLKDLRILDFGCGTGLLTEHLAKEAKQIVAIDFAEKMIEVLEAKKLKNVTAICAELDGSLIEKHHRLHQKFDLILAVSVCAFLPNYQEVLSHIKCLLKPSGLFIQLDWLQNKAVSDFGFSEEMIRNHFQAVDLKVESIHIPFYFQEYEEKMDVIMAVGKL